MKKVEPIYIEDNGYSTKITLYACDLLSIIKNDVSFDLGNNKELLFSKTTGDVVYCDNNNDSEVYLDDVTFSV